MRRYWLVRALVDGQIASGRSSSLKCALGSPELRLVNLSVVAAVPGKHIEGSVVDGCDYNYDGGSFSDSCMWRMDGDQGGADRQPTA
jgi:hypothetical protein